MQSVVRREGRWLCVQSRSDLHFPQPDLDLIVPQGGLSACAAPAVHIAVHIASRRTFRINGGLCGCAWQREQLICWRYVVIGHRWRRQLGCKTTGTIYTTVRFMFTSRKLLFPNQTDDRSFRWLAAKRDRQQ